MSKQLISKTIFNFIFIKQESSITDEVEAELRPPSTNSSHTPLLPSKKMRPPRDDSLPSPRGLQVPGSGSPSAAIIPQRSTLVQLRRAAAGQPAKAGKQAPTPPKRTRLGF